MSEELKEVFEHIKELLTYLNIRWIIYKQMYGTNAYRLELLNNTASNTFSELQWLVMDNMVLSLSKLTDPARMRGHSNLSLPYLHEEIIKLKEEKLSEELSAILEELDSSVENFRKIRNKRIAHTDLAVAVDDNSPLPGVSRADINKALELVMDFLNTIELHYFDSTTRYDMTILPLTNDGRALLIWLQKALAYEKLEDDGVIERGFWRGLGEIDEVQK